MGSLFFAQTLHRILQDLACRPCVQLRAGIAQRTLAKDDPVTFFGSHPPDVNTFRFAGRWCGQEMDLATVDFHAHIMQDTGQETTHSLVNDPHATAVGSCPKEILFRCSDKWSCCPHYYPRLVHRCSQSYSSCSWRFQWLGRYRRAGCRGRFFK